MDLPVNRFKRGLAEGRSQIGLWCTLSSPLAAEAVAGAGYDWLLFDTEHSPTGIETVLSLLQAVAPYSPGAVVRPGFNDAVEIKRLLDIGAQTLLIPFVQSAAEAAEAVAAVRYPPQGKRGLAQMTRANRFGRVKGYASDAGREICLLVQIETQASVDQIEAIAAVDGVDGLFVGPADLGASLGYPGGAAHPEVRDIVCDVIRRIKATGKPAGVLASDPAFARDCIAAGATFTAVGVDLALLVRNADALAAGFRPA